ncbi:major facilitator superfamily domain-containing protein [Zychaea mexicana]|uniref:major facilitator superfamily domain-containing protein n=1 Tax=Zychaea mexicana TaxID=64656 RepID=UPI0022FEDF5C|nr:major facilitator superfamily domain-containing protein [Zychaea mexicana]KAI9496136.1 major facilitator superfamily domain-containing protein [Zychaea mexicana]
MGTASINSTGRVSVPENGNKPVVSIVDDVPHSDEESQTSQEKSYTVDPVLERKLIRKLDSRMLIWSFFAYFANQLDRNNLQNAFTMGMERDLDLNSDVYNWAVTMFFIGYVVLQIPSNMIITKVLPRWFLPSVVLGWGSIVCFMALVTNHQGLWGLRMLMGLVEAAFYPGMIFLLGSWYTKEELGKRMMFFTTGNQVSGAFGGLIAGGISDTMTGAAGLPAWKWLFIIEGLIGVVIGIAGYFLLPNFPHHRTYWLTEEERELAIARIQHQGSKVKSATFNFKTIANVLATPYAWLQVLNFSCIYIGNQLSLNFAIILRGMGYEVAFANYMNTPAYLFGAIAALVVAWSSDKTGDRIIHIAVTELWVGVWYLILGVVGLGNNPPALLFVGVFAIAVNISLPALCLAWITEIYQADHNSRAVAIAFINAVGNLAPNFINLRAWIVSDAPAFFNGKMTSMGMSFGSVLITLVIAFLLRIKFMLPQPVEKKGVKNFEENDTSSKE